MRPIFEQEHEQFRDSFRKFCRTEIAPHADRWWEQGHVDREAFRKAGDNGFLLTTIPEAYGGMGIGDFRYEQILCEENVRHGDIGFYASLHSIIVAPYISELGTEEQKLRYLPRAASGEAILAIAMTEPGAGSDLAGIKATAVDRGDHWLLNGSKTYISNGLNADVFIVAAKTAGVTARNIGLFIVESGMEGFKRGRMLKKMGMRSQDTLELFFNDVKVPKENLLGDPLQGFRSLAKNLAVERLSLAWQCMAAADTAFDLTLDFVKQRKAFGKPIGSLQNTRFKMAEMRAQIDSSQAYVDQCTLLANDRRLSSEAAAQAKLISSELEGRVLDECLQLHGGAGYMEEMRICRMYMNARVTRIFAGTSEIMKEIIARGLGLDERKI